MQIFEKPAVKRRAKYRLLRPEGLAMTFTERFLQSNIKI